MRPKWILAVVVWGSIMWSGIRAANASPPITQAPSDVSVDGIWATLPPSLPRHIPSMVYDSRRNRAILFGGLLYGRSGGALENDAEALPLPDGSAWVPLGPFATEPEPRYGNAAIYDPLRDRMIIFGGIGPSDAPLDDLWSLDLSGATGWTRLSPSGAPPGPQGFSSAIYDPIQDRMLLMARTSVFELSLHESLEWHSLSTVGPPADVLSNSAVYDPLFNRALALDDATFMVKALSLDSAPPVWYTASSGRQVSATVLDSRRNRLILVGGDDIGSHDRYYHDLFVLTLGNNVTSIITPSGTGPTYMFSEPAVYDSVDDMIVGAGVSYADSLTGSAYSIPLNAPAWVPLPVALGPPDACGAAVYDAAEERVLTIRASGVWSLSLTGLCWTPIATTGELPSRTDFATAFDSNRNSVLVFGGTNAFGVALRDLWELTLTGTPRWEQLPASGISPPALLEPRATFDPVGDRLILEGGGSGTSGGWVLPRSGGSGWSEIPAMNGPGPRSAMSLVYDPAGNRVVAFGGYTSTRAFDDFYELRLDSLAWRSLDNQGVSPGARHDQDACYDPIRHRMILFGGTSNGSYADAYEVLLTSPLEAWMLNPSGVVPDRRTKPHVAFDTAHDRMVVVGGGAGGDNDLCGLSFRDATTPTRLMRFNATPTTRGIELRWRWSGSGPPSGYRVERADGPFGPWSMIVRQGHRDGDDDLQLDTEVEPGRTYFYRLVEPLPDGSVATWGLASVVAMSAISSPVLDVIPNPAHQAVRVRFLVPEREAITVRVVDLAGRTCATLVDGVLPAGEHSTMWLGSERTHYPPGIYFVRAETTRGTVQRSFVLLK